MISMHTETTQKINAAQTLALKGIIAEQEREIMRLRKIIVEAGLNTKPESDPQYSLGQ